MRPLNNFYPSPGLLVAFEGVDGCGKTTQIQDLQLALVNAGHKVTVCGTPGGTRFGQKVREILFHDPELTTKNLNGNVSSLMYLASHLQSWEEVVKPALDKGHIVLSDRWDGFSGRAFAAAGVIPIDYVFQSLRVSVSGPVPDLTIYMYGDPEKFLERTKSRESSHQNGKNWASDIAKMHKVSEAYNQIFSTTPNVVYVEADKMDQKGVHDLILREVTSKIASKRSGVLK